MSIKSESDSHSLVSDSLWPHGLWPDRLLCPWRFSRQEYCNGLSIPSPGDLSNPGTNPRSPALWADSLSSEPPRKPLHVNYMSIKYKCEKNKTKRRYLRLDSSKV